jgi:hypothetical protein
MSDDEPPEDGFDVPQRTGGRHRAPPRPLRRTMVRLVAPVTAVAAVVAVVLVLIAVNGHSSGNQPGPGVITAPSTTSAATTPSSPTPSVSPRPSGSTAPRPQPAHSTRPASQTAMAPVRVYNSTRTSGLAHHVAAEIENRGWTVTDIGNATGAPSRTTLYYSPTARAAAQHLAREFSGIRQLVANRAVGIDYPGLTLVITSDWHD